MQYGTQMLYPAVSLNTNVQNTSVSRNEL